ncbi:hypothetical protein T492DRAFT_1042347 [Pavlovales sp. CCMP2436]|nr:hypothetical protein T492DRAFT_1042347 [Pavlovales sp. CCMP2436]
MRSSPLQSNLAALTRRDPWLPRGEARGYYQPSAGEHACAPRPFYASAHLAHTLVRGRRGTKSRAPCCVQTAACCLATRPALRAASACARAVSTSGPASTLKDPSRDASNVRGTLGVRVARCARAHGGWGMRALVSKRLATYPPPRLSAAPRGLPRQRDKKGGLNCTITNT